MTSAIDIFNRALSEIGARAIASSFEENSKEAVQGKLWYEPLFRQMLRAAPWGFARKTASLTLLGTYADGTSPYPMLYKYAYPADCVKLRYLLSPPATLNTSLVPATGDSFLGAGLSPNRAWRFLIATDVDEEDNQRKVILSNISPALAVYTAEVTSPDLWDDLFQQALVSALAFKTVIPLTGNVSMKAGFKTLADEALLTARTPDANEAINSTNHTPDWIAVRGGGYGNLFNPSDAQASMWGSWYTPYDAGSWGM